MNIASLDSFVYMLCIYLCTYIYEKTHIVYNFIPLLSFFQEENQSSTMSFEHGSHYFLFLMGSVFVALKNMGRPKSRWIYDRLVTPMGRPRSCALCFAVHQFGAPDWTADLGRLVGRTWSNVLDTLFNAKLLQMQRRIGVLIVKEYRI